MKDSKINCIIKQYEDIIIKKLRTIKSFVIRNGRMTKSQNISFEKLWQKYEICCEQNKKIDPKAIFNRKAKTVLEIGFGNGQSLLEMAIQNPDINFIGIEVYKTGIYQLLSAIEEKSLTNIKILHGDAVEFLKNNISVQSIDIIQLFFPDPWQKKRHHKRRIVQHDFVDLIHKKLTKEGIFHVATDWKNYAMHILEIMQSRNDFVLLNEENKKAKTLNRIITKFENRGHKLGHKIYEFVFYKEEINFK